MTGIIRDHLSVMFIVGNVVKKISFTPIDTAAALLSGFGRDDAGHKALGGTAIMKDAISMDVHGIKCDACDYKDETVAVEQYDAWVNKPCPVCGANLLTEDDYSFVKKMLELVTLVNKELTPLPDDEEMITTNIKLDGTGSVEIIRPKGTDPTE